MEVLVHFVEDSDNPSLFFLALLGNNSVLIITLLCTNALGLIFHNKQDF